MTSAIHYSHCANHECLFDDGVSRRLRCRLSVHPDRLARAVAKLEEFRSKDHLHLTNEPSRMNILTFFYWCHGQRDLAKELNDKACSFHKDNISTLAARRRLLLDCKDLEEAKSIECEMKRLIQHQSRVCEMNSRAEIAYACHYLGPPFYTEGFTRFKRLIDDYDALGNDDKMKLNPAISSWHFYSAQLCRRILSSDLRRPYDETNGFDVTSVWNTIVQSLNYATQHGDEALKVRSTAEFVAAYQKCHQLGDAIGLQLPNSEDIDAFVKNALEHYPDNPHIVETCGSYYRKLHSGDDNGMNLEIAIDVFRQYKGPPRNVHQHQMGLAYRQLASNLFCQNKFKPSTRSQECLKKAKTCFEQANELTKRNNFLYLFDLAWTLSYLQEDDKADELFAEASRLVVKFGNVDDIEASQMYSIWANHKCRRRRFADQSVLRLNREAVRLAVGQRTNRYLRKTFELYKKNLQQVCHQREVAHLSEVLKLECDIATVVSQNLEGTDYLLIDVLKSNADVAEKAKKIVTEYCDTHGEPSSAALYLTALIKARQMDTNKLDERLLAVNVAKKIYDDSNLNCSSDAKNLIGRLVFTWLVGDAAVGDIEFGDSARAAAASSSPYAGWMTDEKPDVCVLQLSTSNDASEQSVALNAVVPLLVEHLGLYVIVVEDTSTWPISDISAILKQSNALIVVGSQCDGSAQCDTDDDLKGHIKRKQSTTTVVFVEEEAGNMVVRIDTGRWQRPMPNGDSNRNLLAHFLLTAIANGESKGKRKITSVDDET